MCRRPYSTALVSWNVGRCACSSTPQGRRHIHHRKIEPTDARDGTINPPEPYLYIQRHAMIRCWHQPICNATSWFVNAPRERGQPKLPAGVPGCLILAVDFSGWFSQAFFTGPDVSPNSSMLNLEVSQPNLPQCLPPAASMQGPLSFILHPLSRTLPPQSTSPIRSSPFTENSWTAAN